MAVVYKSERSPIKYKSDDALSAHLIYVKDPTDKDHAGMILLPGRNYQCDGNDDDDLIKACKRMLANHLRIKDLKKVNKRTYRLWGELIYNLGIHCHHTPEEREAIERKIIDTLFPDVPCRAVWHIDPETGYDDLHIIFAHTRPNGEPTLKRTGTHLNNRFDALDQWCADLLNNAKKKPKNRNPKIKTVRETAAENSAEIARENGKPKPLPLCVQVAQLAEKEGLDEVEDHHLPGLLERLGIRIKEIINDVIYYFSSRTKVVGKNRKNPDPDNANIREERIGRINIDTFLIDVFDAQLDIRIERDRERNRDQKPKADSDDNPGDPG